MSGPFNPPRNNRWTGIDARRPENMPFADWAEEQTRRAHNEHGPWITAELIAEQFERLLRQAAGEQRERHGDPGE